MPIAARITILEIVYERFQKTFHDLEEILTDIGQL